jgi:hypothetical protein
LRARVFGQDFIFFKRVGGFWVFLSGIHSYFRSEFWRGVLNRAWFIFTIWDRVNCSINYRFWTRTRNDSIWFSDVGKINWFWFFGSVLFGWTG